MRPSKRWLLLALSAVIFCWYLLSLLPDSLLPTTPMPSTSRIGLSFASEMVPSQQRENHASAAAEALAPSRDADIAKKILLLELIWQKSVLSQADLKQKQDVLCDQELITEVAGRLAKPSFEADFLHDGRSEFVSYSAMPQIQFRRETSERQKYVKFLVQSLAWTANPAAARVNQEVRRVILSPSISQTDDSEQKKMLAGDKIELYLALMKASPEAADELYDISEGSTQNLLQYARDRLGGSRSVVIDNLYR